MNFNYDKIMKPNVVVHCKTEKQANQLLQWADSKNLTWCNGTSYLENNHWDICKENTCYYLLEGCFDKLEYFLNVCNKIYNFGEVVLKKTKKTRKIKFL